MLKYDPPITMKQPLDIVRSFDTESHADITKDYTNDNISFDSIFADFDYSLITPLIYDKENKEMIILVLFQTFANFKYYLCKGFSDLGDIKETWSLKGI